MAENRSYSEKRSTRGELVVVLQGKREGRDMRIEQIPSRALLKGEIHELIVTDQDDLAPGSVVHDVAYLGFFEVSQSGVVHLDDEMRIGGELRGRLAGFDLTHFPNHLNIIFKAPARQSGSELGLKLGDQVVLSPPAD